MPHITKVLGQEAGLQFQGVKDKTGSTGQSPVNGVLVGSFKRGRLDQTMTVTLGNINAMLGYEPDNPDYVTVLDYLNTGVPSVQVLRLVSQDLQPCNPTSVFFTTMQREFQPYTLLKYWYNFEIIDNGETTTGADFIEVPLDASGLPYDFSTLLHDLIRKHGYLIMDDSYAFTVDDSNLISGVEGTKSKKSITLKISHKYDFPEEEEGEKYLDFFDAVRTVNDLTEFEGFTVHSCGFNSF